MSAVRFLEAGTAGTPLVCLHGIGGGARSFRAQLDTLSTTRRTLAWNMPGYGGTPQLPNTDFASLTLALIEALDAHGIDRFHLLGHSIGGMIAIEAALQHPDRVASLVLAATTSAFGGRDDTFKRRFLDARLAPLDAGRTMHEMACENVPHLVGPGCTEDVIADAVATMGMVPEGAFRRILNCLVTFNRYREIERLAQPCCLVAGEVDTSAPLVTMQKMAARIPAAEFHELPACGHLVLQESADACNALIQTFLTRVETKNQEST